ncbi:MAG: antibiotic biosynthesis monooxygenase [Bacteroidetes bacterium]|nr:antibiotic biosynthesis monooxygenase [Bacteroidota bacterium]
MITEIALLKIRGNESKAFEKSFEIAQKIIAGMNGYINHELQKCLEEEDKYMLIVRWEKLEDHTEGFRKSEEYQQWKKLLHHYYDPFPTVEHYKKIY